MTLDSKELELPAKEAVHILIVDDEKMVLEVMKSYIASFGFHFATATNGQEACEELKKQHFDIVITDINMPKMDGMALLKHVCANYPQTGVIVVTGLSEEYGYTDVIKAGAIDYITKPFDGNELHAKLQRVLREQTLVKKLEQMSISDSLTGLYNRRHFDTKITEELQRAVRQNYAVFLAFMDVDLFKGYNDAFGHQVGDNLLATIGKILLSSARRGVDWAFRYGGDEFAVIITQTTTEQALQVCQRIMKSFKEYQFGDTSLSCGLAEFRRDESNSWAEDVERYVEKTDKALYEAKSKGRDQIVCGDAT